MKQQNYGRERTISPCILTLPMASMLLTSQLVKASVGDAFVILPLNAVRCRRRDRRRSRPQR